MFIFRDVLFLIQLGKLTRIPHLDYKDISITLITFIITMTRSALIKKRLSLNVSYTLITSLFTFFLVQKLRQRFLFHSTTHITHSSRCAHI